MCRFSVQRLSRSQDSNSVTKENFFKVFLTDRIRLIRAGSLYAYGINSMSHKNQVLQLYRKIFRLARVWEALEPSQTISERSYIKEEARKLFRRNQNISDPGEIKTCIEEAKSRIELAVHYKIPYPRPVNVALNFVPSSKNMKTQLKRTKQSQPIYTHSQD
jgi:hypothetical protein